MLSGILRFSSLLKAFKRDENLKIPDNINYDSFSGFSNEVKSKFKQIKPKTMGQALRIDGITPAAVFILLSHLKRKSIKKIAIFLIDFLLRCDNRINTAAGVIPSILSA